MGSLPGGCLIMSDCLSVSVSPYHLSLTLPVCIICLLVVCPVFCVYVRRGAWIYIYVTLSPAISMSPGSILLVFSELLISEMSVSLRVFCESGRRAAGRMRLYRLSSILEYTFTCAGRARRIAVIHALTRTRRSTLPLVCVCVCRRKENKKQKSHNRRA